MSTPPKFPEKGMLLPVEDKNLQGEYRNFFVAKRTNYFASIQELPELWDCFLRLDEAWHRGLTDCGHLTNTRQLIPLQLFTKSHAQFRLAFELGFSTCLGDAWNLGRGPIDSAMRGHKIFREPMLGHVWLDKDKGRAEQDAYRKAFEANKKESLFPKAHGLEELHEFYVAFSETGTHSTLNAMAMSYGIEVDSTGLIWSHNYLEGDPKKIALCLQFLLNGCALIEKAFHDCFEDRLKLDHVLEQMRDEFKQKQKASAGLFIKKFKLAPPPIFKP